MGLTAQKGSRVVPPEGFLLVQGLFYPLELAWTRLAAVFPLDCAARAGAVLPAGAGVDEAGSSVFT